MTSKATLGQVEPGTLYHIQQPRRKQTSFQQGSFRQLLKSPHREPESARPFLPGDPVSFIDWKAFAKTDQLLMREVTPNAQTNISIVLELSPSMYWPTQELIPGSITKSELIARVSFYLAYFLLRSGNNVLFIFSQNSGTTYFRPRSSKELLAKFVEAKSNAWSLAGTYSKPKSFEIQKGQDTRFLFSDGFHLSSELDKYFKGNTLFFHSLSQYELSTEWTREKVCYFDGTSNSQEYMGKDLQSNDYHQKIQHWKSDLQNKLKKPPYHCNYIGIEDTTPLESFLYNLTQILNPRTLSN